MIPIFSDYMDRFLDEQENPPPVRDRSASPINSLIYGDPKRHHTAPVVPSAEMKDPTPADIAAALEMVQKVVDPEKVFNDIKIHPELSTAATTSAATVSCAEHVEKRKSPESSGHTASFTSASASPSTAVSVGGDPDTGEPLAKRSRLEKDDNDMGVSEPSVAPCEAALPSSEQEAKSPAKVDTDILPPHSEVPPDPPVILDKLPPNSDSESSNSQFGKVEVSIASTTIDTVNIEGEMGTSPGVASTAPVTAESVAQ